MSQATSLNIKNKPICNNFNMSRAASLNLKSKPIWDNYDKS